MTFCKTLATSDFKNEWQLFIIGKAEHFLVLVYQFC